MRTAKLLAIYPLLKLYKYFELPYIMPISYVFLLTKRCNLRCRTCGIWKEKPRRELGLGEWLKIIKGLKKWPFWITFTGGEPFLVDYFDRIVVASTSINNPAIICIATNGSLPDVIKSKLSAILKRSKSTKIIVNLSLDNIGKKHDQLRRKPGSFKQVQKTIAIIKKLKTKHRNLLLGINTVISKFNFNEIYYLYDYITKVIKPDDYILEPAQKRFELNTRSYDIAPERKKLKEFLRMVIRKTKHSLVKKRGISFVKNLIRVGYYKNLLEPSKKKCNAGLLSCQIMPNSEVVACGVRHIVFGHLNEFDYDFRKLWLNRNAIDKRNKLRKSKCSCQLANIYYTNRFI